MAISNTDGCRLILKAIFISILINIVCFIKSVEVAAEPVPAVATSSQKCIDCHRRLAPALVREWEGSRHFQSGVACLECHGAESGDIDAWLHEGSTVSALVTPKDCGNCHDREYAEFARSHHARAGEILTSLDNVLAEKVAGMPGNIADAVNGCWQCHGTIIKFERDNMGQIIRLKGGKPKIDPMTWPNSGMGRLNPDGSKGSCHACHSRHAFQAKLSRGPENCGKCHMGPDHPQIEIYNESKHGIAFYTNRDRMALEKEGDWIVGRDYSAAPTCATCHVSSYMTPDGVNIGNSHDVGERISWTLRPVISSKLNMVVFEDGYKEDYPETRPLPKIGESIKTIEKQAENEKMVGHEVPRKVSQVIAWQDRRQKMKGVCLNCHNDTYIDNFYGQFDNLVSLYNDKFAKPAQQFMNELAADSILKPNATFEYQVQWVFYELWHHEGRRARHGASMMGPDYTHWHGMYEVSKHFYTEFLPEVIKAAAEKNPELGKKYQKEIGLFLTGESHIWLKGLSPKEAESLREAYKQRYNQ
jgi:formate-dependent nitrite reductase cytochrome c552 subunit